MTGLTLFNNNTHTDIFDRLFGFDDLWKRPLVRETKDYHNPLVKDLEDKYEISLIAPGLEKKDFKITLEGNQINLTYATKYSKSYSIPHDCDQEKTSAKYKNGVLVVSLFKSESAKPKTIEIK